MNVGLLHDRRRWPSRPSAAARESSGSTSPYAAWGCEAQPCRPASPSRGRDSRCAEQGDRANVRQRRSRAAFDIQLHQALRRKADHPAQKLRVRGLLQKGLKGHSLVGHRRVPRLRCDSQPDPTGESAMTAASRSLATALWRARFASGLLHHQMGHDREPKCVPPDAPI